METVVFCQFRVKTSEKVIPLPESNYCLGVQVISKVLIFRRWMLCIRQQLDGQASYDLQRGVLGCLIDGEHNLMGEMSCCLKPVGVRKVPGHE